VPSPKLVSLNKALPHSLQNHDGGERKWEIHSNNYLFPDNKNYYPKCTISKVNCVRRLFGTINYLNNTHYSIDPVLSKKRVIRG
jgi:hypothetical protein